MNVLADFLVRVQEQFPESIENEELNPLLLTIRNQAAEIASLNKEVTSLRTNILNADEGVPVVIEEVAETEVKKADAPVRKRAPRKAAAKKTTAKDTKK